MTDHLEIIEVLPPMHPGEVLREEFMKPLNLTAYAIAKAIKVPRTRIERIAREDLGISGDTAIRLGRFFNVDPRFWINLQSSYELRSAAEQIGDLGGIEAFQRAA